MCHFFRLLKYFVIRYGIEFFVAMLMHFIKEKGDDIYAN